MKVLEKEQNSEEMEYEEKKIVGDREDDRK
jgi:hypothetical protein